MYCSKQVGCSYRLNLMLLASSFTAPDLASQHSLTSLCQWHGAIKLWRFLHDHRAIELFGLHRCNLHLLWWSAKRMFCHLSIALCLRIKSRSVPLDQQHQRCAPQIAGVEGLRPPQDGFYSLVHLWCSVSFTHLNLEPVKWICSPECSGGIWSVSAVTAMTKGFGLELMSRYLLFSM